MLHQTGPSGDEAAIKEIVARVMERYEEEIGTIRASISDDANPHNSAVLEKRAEILDRRRQYFVRIGDILINLGHQLMLIEDTFGLINDEIRARSPEQVLLDIDDVVQQTDSLSDTLDQVAPFDGGAG